MFALSPFRHLSPARLRAAMTQDPSAPTCSWPLAAFGRLGLLGLLCLAGCADRSEALAQQLGQLEREVGRLRATQAASQDRLSALEQQLGAQASARAPVPEDRPKLEVVHLSPVGPDAPPDSEAALEPESDHGVRIVVQADRRGGSVETVKDRPAAPVPPGSPRPAAK